MRKICLGAGVIGSLLFVPERSYEKNYLVHECYFIGFSATTMS